MSKKGKPRQKLTEAVAPLNISDKKVLKAVARIAKLEPKGKFIADDVLLVLKHLIDLKLASENVLLDFIERHALDFHSIAQAEKAKGKKIAELLSSIKG